MAELLVRFRWLILTGILALTAALAPGIRRLGIDYSVDTFLVVEDPELEAAIAHYDEFPVIDSLVFCGFEAKDPLSDAALAVLEAFESGASEIAGVARVTSLLSAPGLAGLPRDALRARAESSRLYRRLFVALPEGGAGALSALVELERDARSAAERHRILRALEAVCAALPTVDGAAPDVRLMGFPVLRDTYIKLVAGDERLFLPLAGALTAILLILIVPGLGLSLATLMVVPLTLVWTFGLLGYLGGKLVLLTSTLPTLLMVIAVADAVHLSLCFRDERISGATRLGAAQRAVRRTAFPCFLTSLTTGIGFASLCVADVANLRALGAYAALGITIAFGLTIVLLPILLPVGSRLLGDGTPRHCERRHALARGLGAAACWLGALPRRAVFACFAGVVVLAVAFASTVEQDSYTTEDLWPDTPIVEATRWFEKNFVGPVTGEIVVEAKHGSLFDPAALAELRAFLGDIEQRDSVIRTLSFADALDDGLPRMLMPLLRKRPVALFSKDMKTARVLTFMRDVGARESERYVEAVRARAAGLKLLDARPVGLQIVATRLVTSLIDEMRDSFFLAFGLISILMTLVFRSLRFGLLAIVPNLFPLLVSLGFMGATGIRMRTVVVMTFAIAFGLAVDNTIHVLSRFRYERSKGKAIDAAVHDALERVGTAVWTTSLLLLLGFGLLLTSGFRGSHDFGLLACVTILGALLGDLILLPALLRTFGR